MRGVYSLIVKSWLQLPESPKTTNKEGELGLHRDETL